MMTSMKIDRRSQLRAAYLFVVDEWAPEANEVAAYLAREGYTKTDDSLPGVDKKATKSLLSTLRRKNLVEPHVVNGEGPAVWQSYYSIQDGDSRADAERDFDKAFPEGTVKEQAPTGRTGAYGSRYTADQIARAIEMKGRGESWKAIGAKLNIKATAHLAKVVKPLLTEQEKSAKK